MLIIRSSKLYYTASGIITPVGGRPVHRLREDWGARSAKHNLLATSHVIQDSPIALPWPNTTRLQKYVNWIWFFGRNELLGGMVLAVWKIGTQDAPATSLGRLTLVSAPTAVRLRVVGLPGPIKSAVKATGWWRFLCMPWQGRGSHGTGPQSRLRHGSFLRHEKWHY